MEMRRRAQIQQSLRNLADSYKAMMQFMEQTFDLLCAELDLDPWTYFRGLGRTSSVTANKHGIGIDHAVLSVVYRGKSCFLGDTLAFKLITFLARRPNVYFT